MANTTKNLFETMLDTQNQLVDNLVETSKKMTSGNPVLTDVLEKGTTAYKNAIDQTKKSFETATEKTQGSQEELKKSMENINSYFKNWYQQQVDMSKKMFDLNSGSLNNMYNQSKNPQTWMDTMTEMWNKANNTNALNNLQHMMNPSSIQDTMKKGMEDLSKTYNNVQENFQKMYTEGLKNMSNTTTADAYKGMFNMADGFSKFHDMWAPMLSNMKSNDFNMDTFNQMFDLNKFKSFMDQYFSFMPKGNEEYMNKINDLMKSSFSTNNTDMMNLMNTMKTNMTNMMPSTFANPLGSMLDQYTNMQAQMAKAVSPFSTLFQSNDTVKSMEEMQDILNRTNIYNIKNAQMQQMVYETGAKVMEQMAAQLMHKAEHGEEIKSIIALYQDYLTMSDAAFVALFETDEYSQLMAEVSAMQLRLKKDMQLQTEKMFTHLPLATRSEMDELYKTIYELKKELRGQKTTPSATATSTKTEAKKVTPKKVVTKNAVAKKVVVKKAAPKKAVAKKTSKK